MSFPSILFLKQPCSNWISEWFGFDRHTSQQSQFNYHHDTIRNLILTSSSWHVKGESQQRSRKEWNWIFKIWLFYFTLQPWESVRMSILIVDFFFKIFMNKIEKSILYQIHWQSVGMEPFSIYLNWDMHALCRLFRDSNICTYSVLYLFEWGTQHKIWYERKWIKIHKLWKFFLLHWI